MNDHSRRVYDSVLGMLSSEENPTPMVRLNRVVDFEHTVVFAKLEWFNPFGAVKDRVAANMLEDAEQRGVVGAGQKLVEPTSGNTGMGLAMLANVRGYSLTTPLSKLIPAEKRTVLRFFGSNLIELDDNLCPAPGAPEGAIARANAIAGEPGYHMLNQYANEANPQAHFKTTGPEIWRQTEGKVTHFVAGLGTCGTVTGTGRFLKEKDSAVQVLGVHPAEGHDIPGVRSLKQLEQTALFRPQEYDGMVEISNQEAYDLCLRLNREESITAGPSSAMALAGALRTIPDEPGNIVVVIFPDSVFKYASSLAKHLTGVEVAGAVMPKNGLLETMVENVRGNPDVTLDQEHALETWTEEKPFVVDVRDFETFRQGHIPGATNIPHKDLAEYVEFLPEEKDRPILTVCYRGNSSLSALLFIRSLGYSNVRSVNGGMNQWIENGFPTLADEV